MQLFINGDPVEVPDTVKTVLELLQHFQLDQKVVIVEKNKDILNKENHESEGISDGDQLEFVHFVGGG
ncbi:sulfur carrier protein ThiS [Sutcliffiella rhizosphaerae]|uniref:Sulfur carrier protein ThiS n=1 Tax=Sutcliffiella rhizosphaerae TaxID=2880967 RepID=A0ABM8YRL0_9BACI|nr:sulfur carrier protein ThiS [Sutcliffiella rhizosphaerae]CAG9622586.1 Sulfur carrier protein ThiS [Sutcliffiella rhizosphaerae]